MPNRHTKKCRLKPQKEANTQLNRMSENKMTDNIDKEKSIVGGRLNWYIHFG